MKKLLMMMAALSLLTFGMVSCDRNDDTTDNPTTPTSVEWVDLDLPSGLLWANCNLGAITPEGSGDYYAWGETQTKEVYHWDTYTYGDCDIDESVSYTMYKYNTSEDYGTIDNKATLESSDDVATEVLGAGARIPTYDDWIELINHSIGGWHKQNGVWGWKLTVFNGNSIFLPAAGERYADLLYDKDKFGYYWSSSLSTDRPYNAQSFSFHSDVSNMGYRNRSSGLSVRAVRDSQK